MMAMMWGGERVEILRAEWNMKKLNSQAFK